MSDFVAVFGKQFFLAGLLTGLVLLAVGWAIHQATGRSIPLVGLLVGAGALVALNSSGAEIGSLVLPVALIAVLVFAARLLRAPTWVHAIASLPGVVWLAVAGPLEDSRVSLLMVLVIPVAGWLSNDFESRHHSTGLGVIFYSLAVVGLFFAVPDTEWALSLLAVSLPLTLLAWPRVAGSLGSEGSYVAVALLVVIAAVGGEGRPPSIVGSIACLGLLIIEPALVAVRPTVSRLANLVPRSWSGVVVSSLPQLAVVFLCSRVAARFDEFPPTVAVIAVTYLTVGFIALRVADSLEPRQRARV